MKVKIRTNQLCVVEGMMRKLLDGCFTSKRIDALDQKTDQVFVNNPVEISIFKQPRVFSACFNRRAEESDQDIFLRSDQLLQDTKNDRPFLFV